MRLAPLSQRSSAAMALLRSSSLTTAEWVQVTKPSGLQPMYPFCGVAHYNTAGICPHCLGGTSLRHRPSNGSLFLSSRYLNRLGGHVHFSVKMGGHKQHVFVSTILVEADAGRLLSRGEAANYVAQNAQHFIDCARRKVGRGPIAPITLDESDRLGRVEASLCAANGSEGS